MTSPTRFEWDIAKARSNLAKHGVRFEVATSLFDDPRCADFDVSHVEDREARRKLVGMIEGRLITVVYASRGVSIRIISARRSNAMEKRRYADG